MSNANPPRTVKEIAASVRKVGQLDQAPSPGEVTIGSPQTVKDIRAAVLGQAREFVKTKEPGLTGFGKGLLGGIAGPARVFGVNPDLEPRQPSGLPALPATPSRIVGEFTGAAAPIILATSAASAGLGISGLEAALGPALSRIVADAIGFGLFEAGHSEALEEVPGEFGKGAAIGAAFGIGHNLLMGRLKGRSLTGEPEVIIEPPPLQLNPVRQQIPSGARAQGPARPMGPVRGPETPKGAGGGPAVSPSSGRVIPVESEVVGEVVNISPKLYERLLETTSGPAKAALEAATVTSRGAQVVAGTGARVQLKKALEQLLNEGAGAVARPAARLRAELASDYKPPIKATLGQPVPAGGPPFAKMEAAIRERMQEVDLSADFEMGALLGTRPDGSEIIGMQFPAVWEGRTVQFGKTAVLNRDLAHLKAGTEVLVREDPQGGINILDLKDPLAVPIRTGLGAGNTRFAALRDVVELPEPREVSFPIGIMDDGSYVLSGQPNSPLPHIKSLIELGVKDGNGVELIPSGPTRPQGLQLISERVNQYASDPVVFSPEEAKVVRDDLVRLKIGLENTQPSQYASMKAVQKYHYVRKRAIPTLLTSLRAFDPTIEEILAQLSTPLVPAERQIPAKLATLLEGTDLPTRNQYLSPQTVIYIHPDASTLENAFFHNRDLEEVFEAVGYAINPDDQLAVAAARVGAAFNYGGTTILTVRKPAAIIKALKKVDPKLRFAVHEHPQYDGVLELLISHPVIQGPRSLIRKTFKEEMYGVLDAVLHDQPPALQLESLLNILRTPLEGELSPNVPIVGGYEPNQLGSGLFGGGAYGTYRFDAPSLGRNNYGAPEPLIDPDNPQLPGELIRLATSEPPGQQFGTLVHEYTHHLFAAIANRAGLSETAVKDLVEAGDYPAKAEEIGFFGLFKQVIPHWNPTPAEYERVFGASMTTKQGDVDVPFDMIEEAVIRDLGHHTSKGRIVVQRTRNLREDAPEYRVTSFVSPDDFEIEEALTKIEREVQARIRKEVGPGIAVIMTPVGTVGKGKEFNFSVVSAKAPRYSEVMEAALQTRARTGNDFWTPIKRGSAEWQNAVRDFKDNVKNFRTDTELAARLVELMAVDMKAAKELAPTATKLMAEVIHEFSPKLTLGIAGRPIIALQDLVDEKAIIGHVRALHPVEKWSRDIAVLSEKKLNQFKREGLFDGMNVKVMGTDYIAERRIPTAGEYTSDDVVILRDPYTGEKLTTTYSSVRRPTDGSTPQADLPQVLKDLETSVPAHVGIVVEDPTAGVAWQVDHSFMSKDGKALFFNGYDDALEYLTTQNLELAGLTLAPNQILTLLANVARKLGGKAVPGMVVRDGAAYKIILPEPLGPPKANQFLRAGVAVYPKGAFDRINAKVGDQIIDADVETIVEGYLRGQVNERDLPALVTMVARKFRGKQLAGLDERVFKNWKLARNEPPSGKSETIFEKARAAAEAELGFPIEPRVFEGGLHTRELNSSAARQGARRRTTTNGQQRVDIDATDARRKAGVFDNTDDYYEYLRARQARQQKMGGLGEESRAAGDAFDSLGRREKVGRNGADGEPPPPGGDGVGGPKSGSDGGGAGLGGGGGTRPPNFGETMDGQSPPGDKWYEKMSDAAQFFGAFITAMENTSKVIERDFGLPAYTRIFQPLQKAIRKVDFEMKAPRDLLDGKSYHDQLKLLEKMLWQVRKKGDRENIVRWMEAMSKQEVAAPGGLMQRGMNSAELEFSRIISAYGLQDDMPYLISTWRMMSNLMRGRKDFGRQYKQMIGQDLSPRVLENLEALRAASRTNKNWEFDAVADVLRLTEPERKVIKTLELTKKFKKDDFSLYAISRHAAARDLPAGYNTMRDAVAAELGLNPLQLKIGRELERLFNATFPEVGIDPKRYLGGYYPHLRSYMAEGIMPDAPYIKDIFPKASNFTANKFRSGELDPYSMEPLKVAYKHVRGILMHNHFDPYMPDVRNVLQQLYAKDRRAFRLMSEYVRELQGKPHQSFTDLQKVIEGTAKILGVDVDREFSRTIVNSIAGLTYSATIPFRAALIARNYFQMVQMIAPRVGMQDFATGLRIALTKEGYAMAKKAGAVTENVAPIMSQEAMFNFTNLRLNQRLQRLTEVGFRWYQKADDLGRGAAFHAQRVRTGRAIDNLMKGKYGDPRSSAAKLKMLEEGKILTFDPLDQEAFIKLFDAGQFEAAKNYLGEMLARETIFRYGHANHPSGWGSIYGRLFGQFGTWPVQYKDYLLQGVTRGTAKDKIQFLATHGAINYGIIRGGMALGYDLESWVSYPSLQYTGGPWSDIAIDMVKLLGGSEMERKMAYKSLQFQFVPTLSDPRAIWLPTSYAVNDALNLFNSPPTLDAALGFRRIERDIDSSALLGL